MDRCYQVHYLITCKGYTWNVFRQSVGRSVSQSSMWLRGMADWLIDISWLVEQSISKGYSKKSTGGGGLTRNFLTSPSLHTYFFIGPPYVFITEILLHDKEFIEDNDDLKYYWFIYYWYNMMHQCWGPLQRMFTIWVICPECLKVKLRFTRIH